MTSDAATELADPAAVALSYPYTARAITFSAASVVSQQREATKST